MSELWTRFQYELTDLISILRADIARDYEEIIAELKGEIAELERDVSRLEDELADKEEL